MPAFEPLGHTIPLNLPFSAFLSRCKEIVKLLENLRPGPLRNILLRFGLKKEDIKDFHAIRLLGTLCQLAAIAQDEGLKLIADSAHIAPKWDVSVLIPIVTPLFKLIALRTADAHKTSSSTKQTIAGALEAFGIDGNQCKSGWGLALDTVYDTIGSSLTAINGLIEEACH